MPQSIFAHNVLTATGWRSNVTVLIGDDGRVSSLEDGEVAGAKLVGVLLPALSNVHSHSFQRAMAGLAESRGANEFDDFWTWRTLMYRFLERLTPDDMEAIAAQVQLEMLEAGFASIGEFHYVHHQQDGSSYDAPAELTNRMLAAAETTGIGYAHLPVLYMRGGFDGAPLQGGQRRFGCDIPRFESLYADIRTSMKGRPTDYRLGVAPHSLRAVDQAGLSFAASLCPDDPIHIHIAEQTAEVDAVKESLGATPVQWLLDHVDVDKRWCLVHATHMTVKETQAAADTGSVVGVCPITEANLGDGVFDGSSYLSFGGSVAVGSDSNVRISLAEELRMFEYSQRLRDRRRAILADADRSCGRFLYEEMASGGARATGRGRGRIEPGALADLVALDLQSPLLAGLTGDRLLDVWLFAGDDDVVMEVWAAGRNVVKEGSHIRRDAITRRFSAVMKKLRSDL
ncbi:MAG: formimidoylglutamate deiminase [Amphiplicatus sp.]